MEQFNKSVSVIIPVYNGEKYLTKTISSVQSQKGDFIKEIILIDDGSVDGSWCLLCQLKERYKNIIILRQKNQGQAKARNYGAKVASGNFLAFLDVDDTWKPNKLEKQIGLFQNDTSLVLVFSNAEIIFDAPKKEKIILFSITKPRRGHIYRWLLFNNFIYTTSVIIKKEIFDISRGFKQEKEYRYIEDYDLWLRIAAVGKVDFIEEPLICYLRHAASSSQAKVSTAINVLRMLKNTPTNRNLGVITQGLVLIRHTLVLIMYFFHLDRLFSPLN